MKKSITLPCVLALSALLLTACGGGGSAQAPTTPPVQPPGPTVTLSISADSPETRVGGYPIVMTASSQPSSSNDTYQWALEAGSPGTISVGADGKASYQPPATSTLGGITTVNVRLSSGAANKTHSFNLYPAIADGALKTLVAAGSGKFTELTDALPAPDGSVFLVDRQQNAVYRLTESGQVSVAAGLKGVPGNDLYSPSSIAWAPDGSLHIFENGTTIKKLGANGELEQVMAIPPLYNKDQLNGDGPMRFDAQGNIFLADWFTIRKIAPDGTLSTLAGKCDAIGEHSGDIVCGPNTHVDGSGTEARFMRPQGMAFAADGSLLIAEGNTLRKVTLQGTVTTALDKPAVDVRVDETGRVIFVGNNAIRQLNADGSATTVVAALGPVNDALRRAVPVGGKRLLLVYKDSVQLLQLP